MITLNDRRNNTTTELTAEYLDFLLERHSDDEVSHIVFSMKEKTAELARGVDPEQKRSMTETLLDDFALLEHLLYEESRSGEDYINDGAFHATG